jgi:hypothetical protein
MSREVGRRVIALRGGAVAIVLITFAAAAYGCVRGRTGREIAIDFTESIDSRLVYPMPAAYEHDSDDIIIAPESVDLRFPGGGTYHSDDADEVWISKRSLDDPDLIESVTVRSSFETPDEVYDRARRLADRWGIDRSRLDPWFEARKRAGPGDWVLDSVMAGRPIDGAERNGKRLTVELQARGDPVLHPPYQLTEAFSWSDPRSDGH